MSEKDSFEHKERKNIMTENDVFLKAIDDLKLDYKDSLTLKLGYTCGRLDTINKISVLGDAIDDKIKKYLTEKGGE